MESLLSEKPYMAPLTTISSTGATFSNREKSGSPNSSCSSSVSTCEFGSEVPRKRKATDVHLLMQNRIIVEDGKNKRHQEKIAMGNKLLERLDKLIEKI